MTRQLCFLLFVAVITAAFAWILLPYAGAILWAVILAILFAPLHRRLLRATRQRQTAAALLSILAILVSVIIPVTLVAVALATQAADLYARVESGAVDFGRYFREIVQALPAWLIGLLERNDLARLDSLQAKLAAGAAQISRALASQAFGVGRYTADLLVDMAVMLYLLFFLFRDGRTLAARIEAAIPLQPVQKRRLFGNVVTVLRATVKGNVLIALIQGALGGAIFAVLRIEGVLLWAVVMALLSLLPSVGAALVWVPVAAYLFVTGDVWQGALLAGFGVLVIGMVDNALRPVLVGKDIRMPDYLILLSTLGGMTLFGLNGFVVGPLVAALFLAAWDLFAHVHDDSAP